MSYSDDNQWYGNLLNAERASVAAHQGAGRRAVVRLVAEKVARKQEPAWDGADCDGAVELERNVDKWEKRCMWALGRQAGRQAVIQVK